MEDNLRIADLISAYLLNRQTPAEEKELKDWLNLNEKNQKLFDQIVNEQKLESNLESLKSFDGAVALKKIKQHPQLSTKGKVSYIRWKTIAAAASIILCSSIGMYFYQHNKPINTANPIAKNDIKPGHNQATLTLANGRKITLTRGLTGKLAQQGRTIVQVNNGNDITYTTNKHEDQVSYNTLSTAQGEQSPYPLVLADGTKVWLNAESSITFPTAFNQKDRIVKVTGEVYFEVAHNAAQPFKVTINNQTIEDIGTQFDVNGYADESGTRTTLIEGIVKVNNILLKPGEQTDGKQVTRANIAKVIAWKDGKFRFTNDDIQTVMRQLARWYNIDISYEGPLTSEGFNAKISRDKNISVILSALERTNGVRFKIDGRRVTVIQ